MAPPSKTTPLVTRRQLRALGIEWPSDGAVAEACIEHERGIDLDATLARLEGARDHATRQIAEMHAFASRHGARCASSVRPTDVATIVAGAPALACFEAWGGGRDFRDDAALREAGFVAAANQANYYVKPSATA